MADRENRSINKKRLSFGDTKTRKCFGMDIGNLNSNDFN